MRVANSLNGAVSVGTSRSACSCDTALLHPGCGGCRFSVSARSGLCMYQPEYFCGTWRDLMQRECAVL